MLTTKQCRVCKETKPEDLFNFRNKSKNLYKKICKECESKENSGRYKSDKDKVITRTKDWQAKNREEYLEYQSSYNERRLKKKVDNGPEM